MKRRSVLLLGLLLIASVAHGQEVRKESFWEKLRAKLEKIAPSKKTATTTAVGGVRGAKNEEANDVYWKGKEKAADMAEEELMKFNLAMESKLKGDNEQALKLFEEFLIGYPQSSLRVEGLQAVEKIKLEMASAKPVPAPAVEGATPASVAPVPAALPVVAPAAVPDTAPQPAK